VGTVHGRQGFPEALAASMGIWKPSKAFEGERTKQKADPTLAADVVDVVWMVVAAPGNFAAKPYWEVCNLPAPRKATPRLCHKQSDALLAWVSMQGIPVLSR
jgi:hypothetical protein